MAKFMENASDIKKSVSKQKKKKKEETVKKAQSPSVSNKTQQTVSRLNQKYGGGSTRQQTVKKPSTGAKKNTAQTASQQTQRTVDRLNAKYGQNRVERTQTQERRFQPNNSTQRISRNPRMLDTSSNINPDRDPQNAANRAVRNTPKVVKESLKQVAAGHGKTAADITSLNESANIGSKIDIKSKEFQEDIEKRRKKSTETAKKAYNEISNIQDTSEQNMQKLTKNAKGLEKAYYGALESGIGMATDQMLGPAWAVSMMSRTYGNTRGKAQQEGATENEDRANALLQGAKEVATEYLFRGVGLASNLSGAKSLSLAEKAAKAATRNMTGTAANVTHAGIRLLGGTTEENIEEAIGWGLDPLISEVAYKRNVRSREAKQMLKAQSDDLRSNITSEEDARAIAAYLGSDDFIESNMKTYMDSGIGEAEARELAEKMRDYLTASLNGDTEGMADIEDELSKTLSGKGLSKESWSLSELMDTVASTTLLTMTTGLPGAMSTAARGAAFLENNSTDRIRALADTAVDFENKEMSAKAEAMRDRIDSGKELTSTQAYDLMQGVAQQYQKDSDRQQAAFRVAENTINEEKLVAPFEMSRQGNFRMGEMTNKEYRSSTRQAKKSIETLVESDESKSLTDEAIDRGSRAIAGFKTGVFTVDDANELNYRNTAVRDAFKAETGIDLNEYIVRDKNGEVDIPATNTATKNALFAQAAENLVVSAQAETANWMDNTKGEVVAQISKRMGAQGAVELQYVLDDVDERDRATYMMTANVADMMYQQGRNIGVEWDAVKADAKRLAPGISEDKLREMYEAGRFDRDRTSDKARGQQIKLGEKVALAKDNEAPMGQVLIDTDKPVKGTVIRAFSEIAKNLGVDIHLVDHFTDKDGKVLRNVNGEYINGAIYINVNSKFEKNIGYIFMHEVTHHLKTFAPEQYQELENLVREKWFKYDRAQMQNEIAKKIAAYERNNQKLTEEQALEEIIADAAHEFLNDGNFARQVAEDNPSLAQAVLESIRNALRRLRQIIALEFWEEDTYMNSLFSQLDILDEAERLWLGAYTQAVKNRAAVDIENLQNRIYEEGRQSISEKPSRKMSDRWENEEKLTHSQFNSWYSAHKLNLRNHDNLAEQIADIKKNGFISNTAMSNVMPASINDYGGMDWAKRTYGARKGDTVLLVPRPYVDLKNDIVKNGFKPRDYEIVTAERDFQPYYELYEKAYDESQTRFSISDSDYMDAVENGDTKAAQKMVDKAAKAAGFTVKGYHGTTNNFNTFRAGDIGFHFGKNKSTARTRVGRGKNTRIIPAWLSLDNPIKVDVDFGSWDADYRLAEYLRDEGIITPEEYQDALTVDNGSRRIKRSTKGANDTLRSILQSKEYDGIEYENYYEAEGATSYIVFDAAQIKNAEPITYDDNGEVIPLSERFNQSSPDIRYSITTDNESLPKGGAIPKSLEKWAKEVGLDTLTKQEVKGPVQVSVRDLRTAWYDKNGRSEEAETINKALESVGDALTKLVGEYRYIDLGDALNATVHYRTDAEGKPTSVILSCQVKNAEYEVNFDFTTICAKRLAMQKVLEKFIKTEGESKDTLYDELKLDEEGLYKLRLILEQAGFEVSCRGCFVEQNRYSQQNQARTIASDWNAALDEWAKENGTEITENFDLVNLDINNLDYDAIEDGFRKYHELMKGKPANVETKNRMLIESTPYFRKRMNPSDYASMAGQRALMAMGESKKNGTNLYGLLKRGQSDSKQSVPFTAYNGEVALLPDQMKKMGLRDYLLSIGGARAQSASDFQIEFLYDYMQLVADLSARDLPMHMYTKVIELAELFGMTGIKINLSAMCDVDENLTGEYAGLKLVDGKYEYNISDQSIDYPKAVELQKKPGYSKNIGIIMVVLSKEHMLKSLGDDDVRYIIGYHSSAMPVVVANMSKMGDATDYTKLNKTNKLNDKGRALFDEAMSEAKGKSKLAKFKDALRIFDEKIQQDVSTKKNKPRRGNEYGSYMTPYKGNTADFNTYEDIRKSGDARKTADNYIEYCMDNDLIPMYFPFAFHENYYKCEVYDFNMYDNVSGEYAPMEGVKNIYPGLNMEEGETDTTEFMGRVSEMMNERNAFNEVQSSMYEPVIEQAKNELRYSITGDDYMDFDESGIDHSELQHRADVVKQAPTDEDIAAGNHAVHKGKAFWSGSASALDGFIEETHTYQEAENWDFHHSLYFSPEQVEKIDNEENVFFWVWDDGSVETEWRNGEAPADIVRAIKNQITTKADGIRFSISEDLDEPYMDAVNSGNMEEAQRIVNEAAERAMPDTKFKGNWYHGTENDFTEFNFSQGGKNGHAEGFGIYITNDPEISKQYGNRLIKGFANVKRPASALESQTLTKAELRRLIKATVENEAQIMAIDDYEGDAGKAAFDTWISNYTDTYYAGSISKAIDEVIDSITSFNGNDMDIVQEIMTGMGIRTYDEASKFYDLLTETTGIDAFETKWGDESEMADPNTPTIAVVFRSSQVKSADPVTYREDGSVIPLSERFDPSNNDIRYSMSTTDSDGNVLTTAQMEYFQNSQARDIFGKLVPVYHATSKGGFTIFDPMRSDDHRSLFFSSKRDVANTYVEKYLYTEEDRLGNESRDLQSWDDLLDFVQDQFLAAGLEWENDSEEMNLDWTAWNKSDGTPAALDYEDWIRLTAEGDPKLENYTYSISIPYDDAGDTGSVKITGNSMVDLINNVSNGNIPITGYYQVYLNLENPLIIEGYGQQWNDIVMGGPTFPSYSYVHVRNADWYRKDAEHTDEMFALGQRLYNGDKSREKAAELENTGNIEIEIFDGDSKKYAMVPLDIDSISQEIASAFGIDDLEMVEGIADELVVDMGWQNHSRFDATDMRNTIGEYAYNTREWAEYAEDEGYDGVIFRNIIDIDQKTDINEEDAVSDIYIAFSSNQVKDTRNENPTNNPDIRFSFTEDEINSRKDYDYASSDTYEMLEMYEDMLSDEDMLDEFVDASDEKYYTDYFMTMLEKYGKSDKRARKTGKTAHIKLDNTAEAIDAFYSSLTPETRMVYDDEMLEEGRKRMATSKQDFWNHLNAKWNDRWVSGGEVLKVESVKKDVMNLVMGIMDQTTSGKKYKTEIVKKTLIDMRLAYQFMKQDRTDAASALLYHSALRMIENVDFIEDDSEYQNYKGLRDYLRNTRIHFSEEYWNDVDFQAYRKRNMSRVKIVKGPNDIDKGVYRELQRQWPEYFSEEEMRKNGYKMNVPGMMSQLDYVLNLQVDPVAYAYSSEECAEWAFTIADDLYSIMENGVAVSSLADQYEARNEANIAAEREKADRRVAKEQEKAEKSIAAEKARTEKAVLTAKGYKEKFDEQARAMKVRHAEAILRIRKAKEEGIAAEKAKFKEYREEQKEKKYHTKYFDSISESHKKLTERLTTNTKDKHIPEQYKKQLAKLLAAFDLQTVGSKKLEIKKGLYYRQNYKSQKTIKMQAIKNALINIEANSPLFEINDSITDIIDRLLGKNEKGEYKEELSIEGKTIDALTASELKDIDKMLKALIHEFNNYESVRVGIKRQQAADIGSEQIKICLNHVEEQGEGKDWQNFLGHMDNILSLDEVTPAYMFRMIDRENTGIGTMFKELRRAFGKYVKNQEQLNKWMDDILGEYHNNGKLWNKYGSDQISNWRLARSAREFRLESGKTISLTPAQMMSIYCLSNRAQALDHMTGAGVVIQPVTFMAKMETDLKRKANPAIPAQLTMTDIMNIKNQLTPDQIKVADKLQKLMANEMAEWGNEASMAVIGIRLFEDRDYFPIKSDKAALEKDFSADQFTEAIRNFGFTKAVQPGASNSIAVGDIFDVVAEHCNQMNLYNAYSEAMNDFMKVYNYHERQDTDTGYTDYSVEQAIAYAFSKKATTYIGTFMKDLNGNVSRDRMTGIESMMNDLLGKAKKTSVFANGRVALQQPTAIMRAFAVIDPKYIKGISATNATMNEMFEHSPIALWKSWGYYDINMGKSIEDLMMNNGKWLEDRMTDLYGKLDNRTWAAIWGMCKAEVEDKHKDVKPGTDDYWELVSERFDEVVDLTQVVDSPFHRSHAMRSKNTLIKMATAFMSEPTLTFNMVRDGFIRAREQRKLGNKAESRRITGRTLAVFVISAGTTAAAAAIWDMVRGKDADSWLEKLLGGDDDDDDTRFGRWWDNFLANLEDNLNLLNNIYYVKDVVSIFQGWDQRNLGLQGFKHLADGYRQLTGQKVYSSMSWWQNIASGVGYLTGYPVKTVMNDMNKLWKGVFGLFGLTAPEPFSAQLEKLDAIGGSSKDVNSGSASSAGISNNSKTSTAGGQMTSARLWTYDNAPFRIEDGSLADNFLNHFGINLTAAELKSMERAEARKKMQKEVDDIKEKTADLTGEAKSKKVWSYVTTFHKEQNEDKALSEYIEAGDFVEIENLRSMYVRCGGDTDYFEERIYAGTKKALKKSIIGDPTAEQIEAQWNIKNYLTEHGMSASEMSEIAYKSDTARDLKVAFRINDEEAIVNELVPLIRAGLTREDYERLYKNRNRVNLKTYDGKYKDRLKSTGKYNWPINGQITSGFGHRSSPGGIGSTNHQGLDIAGSMGDPVAAADGGVVVMAGWYGGAGKTVQIQHDDGTITQYSHLSWWDCKVGDTVAQGQTIGNVGSTGNSTGPHLHFGVKVNGSYVNPLDYLN